MAGLILLTGVLVTPSFSGVIFENIGVGVSPRHNISPQPITDLNAEKVAYFPGDEEGKIKLTWTVPQTKWAIPIKDYLIGYSTLSIADFGGDITFWWQNADGKDLSNWWSNSGKPEEYIMEGLIPQVTYYFAMKTRDVFDNLSEIDEKATGGTPANAIASFETIAPAAITDLVAATHIEEGTVKLKWTAPSEDGTTGGAVDSYIVKFATVNVNDVGGAPELWWNHSCVKTEILTVSPKEPGNEETYIVRGLASARYYFTIRSFDDRRNISPVDENTENLNQANALAQVIPPATINDLSVETGYNKATLVWTAQGDDGWAGTASKYHIKYATYPITIVNFESVSDVKERTVTVVGGNSDSDVVTGLVGDTLYYFAIKAEDDAFNFSNMSNVVSTKTLDNVAPAVPTGFSGVGTDHRVDLVWNSNSDYDFAGYNIYRSTFSMGYSTAPLVELTANSYADTPLVNGVTLYYVITSFDQKNNESSYSAETVVTPHDTLPPREPAGMKGTLSADGRTMTITWSSVTRNADGTTIEDLAGYCIYKAPSLDEVYVLKDFIPAGQMLTWTDPDNVKGHTFYYLIKAQDTSHNRSEMSMIVDCSANTNIISPDKADMATYMSIPEKVSSVLYAETNSYDDDIRIKVLRSTGDENGRILKSYTFAAEKGRTHIPVTNISFEKADAEIVLSYKDENGFVDEASKNLAIFGFNGNEWIKLGGDVDEYAHTVRIKTKRLGKFILKNSLRAVTFTIMSTQPDKIFTPNGDGWNDYFEITYENPADGMVNGKIYDLKGRFVKGMEKGGSAGETASSIKWDGRDVSGRVCESGVYLYQIEITGPENKVINGTCVIAK